MVKESDIPGLALSPSSELRQVICPADRSSAFVSLLSSEAGCESVSWCTKFGTDKPSCSQRCIPWTRHSRRSLEVEIGRLEQVCQQLPLGVLMVELPSGRAVLANRRLREIFGEAPVGATWCPENQGSTQDGRRITPDDWPLARTLRSGEAVDAEIVDFVGYHGRSGTVEIHSAPISDRSGQMIAAVATFEEITPRQRLQNKLTDLYTEARKARSQTRLALEREREGWTAVAKSFLGRVPALPGLDVACVYRAANVAEQMGGDFYDFIPLGDNRLGLVIGDVCGKGIPAAVFTAAAKYFLRAYASERWEPAWVLSRLNQALSREISEADRFVTLFYAVLDLTTGKLTYASAGHPSQLLYHPERQRAAFLDATGPVLGIFSDVDYQEETVDMTPGAILTLFTDGITEAGMGSGQPMEEPDLVSLVAANARRPAAEIAETLFQSAEDLAEGVLRDDVALVVLTRK